MKSVTKVVFRGCFIALLCAYLYPIIWMIASSFKTRKQIFSGDTSLVFTPTLSNYKRALIDNHFIDNLLNSVLVAGGSVLISLLLGVPAAYSIVRHSRRGDGVYMFSLLTARLLSPMVLIVPLFVMMTKVGLVGSRASMILAYLTFVMPFVVWMMRGFFQQVPKVVLDAALVDGCGEFRTFWKVALPSVRGGLAATSIFCVVTAWNDFIYALILSNRKTATLPAAIPQLNVPSGTQWEQIMAVSTTLILPVVAFALVAQRNIVSGMTGGAVAGQ